MYFIPLRNFFMYSFLINAAFLLLWFIVFIFAKGLIYKFHRKMFNITMGQFEALHYGGMGLYKILNGIFFLVPFIVLYFATK